MADEVKEVGHTPIRKRKRPRERVLGNATFFSWKSVFAGTVISIISFFLLSVLGVAIGASAFNVGDFSGVTYGWGTALWLIATTAFSIYLGAYVAARLSNYVNNGVGMAQGASIAALFFAFTFWQAGTAVSSLGQGAFGVAGSAATGLGGAANSLAQNSMVINTMERALERSNIELKGNPTEVAQATLSRFLAGDVESARAYLIRNSNLPVEQAREQIEGAIVSLQAEVRDAVNAVADATAALAWSVVVLMIVGILGGLWGGTSGAKENIRHPLARAEQKAFGRIPRPARA